jgi:purine-binding chemotaxis protein CheW
MSGAGFDWDGARAGLERAAAALAPGAKRSEVEAQHILEERARVLARPLDEPAVLFQLLELLVFTRAGESFAIDATRVTEVLRRAALTSLPGNRGFLPGVVHHRGRVLGVVDIRQLIAHGPAAPLEGYAVVVTAGTLTFALFADDVQGFASLPVGAVTPRGSGALANGTPWVRGTTADMVTVVDVEGLAKDARLTVNEPGA